MKFNIDKQGLEALARGFLPDIIAFYQSEEGRREFEEWKRRKAEKGDRDEQNDTNQV